MGGVDREIGSMGGVGREIGSMGGVGRAIGSRGGVGRERELSSTGGTASGGRDELLACETKSGALGFHDAYDTKKDCDELVGQQSFAALVS